MKAKKKKSKGSCVGKTLIFCDYKKNKYSFNTIFILIINTQKNVNDTSAGRMSFGRVQPTNVAHEKSYQTSPQTTSSTSSPHHMSCQYAHCSLISQDITNPVNQQRTIQKHHKPSHLVDQCTIHFDICKCVFCALCTSYIIQKRIADTMNVFAFVCRIEQRRIGIVSSWCDNVFYDCGLWGRIYQIYLWVFSFQNIQNTLF